MRRKILALFSLLCLPLSLWASPECLFVLFDAGETYALKPVIEKCRDHKKDFQVLQLGTARTIDLEIDSHYLVGGYEEVDRHWDRYDPIANLSLEINPRVIVIGVASKIQHQIAKNYQGRGKVIAYYDNFNPIDQLPSASLIREIERDVTLLLVPTQEAAQSSHANKVQVVGHPDLLAFSRSIQAFHCVPSENKIAYIGGYDKEYGEAFRLFVKTCPTGYEVEICPHPKTDGSLERAILKEEKREEMKVCAPKTSIPVIARSAIVICHRSTLGVKAAFAGKQVIFFDLPNANVSNLLVDQWGAAKRVSDQKGLIAALNKPHFPIDLFEQTGIPMDATEQIYASLFPSL